MTKIERLAEWMGFHLEKVDKFRDEYHTRQGKCIEDWNPKFNREHAMMLLDEWGKSCGDWCLEYMDKYYHCNVFVEGKGARMFYGRAVRLQSAIIAAVLEAIGENDEVS